MKVLILIIAAFILYVISPVVFWITIIVSVVFGMIFVIDKGKKEDERAKATKDEQKYLQEHGCVSDTGLFQYISGLFGYAHEQTLYVWTKDDNIYFLDKNNNKFTLPMENVNFYSIKGDMKTETEFTGGSSQSVGTTMVTEGLFGTAAAMKGNKQPLANVKTVDDRRTIINADINGINTFIFFHRGELYNYLLERMPAKEQSFLSMQKQ